ncbi:GumC family protein [Opitutus terrae]|uniref:Capsular exopolysaccharide family n=1 Tax=Opitutus terrae (strain DSM 11246 / JCM 15787 / PB90-1) TaxID=452637 RepID=B1ZZ74_OPITP|nr:polysaccharide biosynthesis tyrosine autokinase [Opitutus terrae]ACB77146.1 capsular exopolysaccharide family [Opitutus terrae PB90-1]
MSLAEAKPAVQPGGARDEETLVERRGLRDYYIILRERLWIALPLALLVAVPLGYFRARETPLYAAMATMQFEKPETVVTSQVVVDPSVRSDIELNTNIQVLNSARMRSRVVESFTPEEVQILQRPYLANLAPGASPPSAGGALGGVSIDAARNSLLITVRVVHPDPEAAALVANRYVNQFMTYLIERVGGVNESAVEFLRNRADQLRKEAEQADVKLNAYMQAHNLVSLDKNKDIVSERLKTISSTLTSAQLVRLNFENQYALVEAYRKEGRNLVEIQFIAGHGTVPTLSAQLSSLLQSQSVLAERYLERHPKMIDLANSIAIVQEQLGKALDLAIADLGTRLNEARENERTLQEQFAKAEKESLDLGALAPEFNSLQNQAQVSKANYLSILDRLNQTTTTKNLEKIPLHPLDHAVVPGAPFTPNLNAIIRLCVGVGVMVFFGVAFGLSFIDDRIKSAWDVESFIGASLLGIIPDLAALKDDEKYSLLLSGKQAPGVEAFLSVYSSVKIHSKLDFPKTVLVTSTIPGEGKTLISCNLAGSFARHGKNTLLIDCDLRRPMLHRHYKQQNNAGLITWFEAGSPLDGELASTPALGIIKISENLSLLCSGGRSKSPTEFLENPVFGQLLERLKREYDLVIIDSPPLGAVTDSMLIAERTDEIIYVCRFNRAYRKHIRLYMKALRDAKNEVLGVVLNGLSPRRIEYYSNYRYYRSYKKYYGSQS